MRKYGKAEQKLLAIWAAECAERVLPFFEKSYPKDKRPRKAIEACREWVRTGIFRMADVRGASLAAHAAAREAKRNDSACFAARAAGHTVATAHIPEHAFGPAYYALKAVASVDSANADAKIANELDWQWKHLPENLRQGWKEWQERRLPKNMKRHWLDFLKRKVNF